MNIVEALRQKRNLRRPIAKHLGTGDHGWISWKYILEALSGQFHTSVIVEEDVLADDWEVQSCAGSRLQERIHQMIRDTNVHPTILDVSEEDYAELYADLMRMPTPDKDRGLWNQLVVYMSHKGSTRIVKARK